MTHLQNEQRQAEWDSHHPGLELAKENRNIQFQCKTKDRAYDKHLSIWRLDTSISASPNLQHLSQTRPHWMRLKDFYGNELVHLTQSLTS